MNKSYETTKKSLMAQSLFLESLLCQEEDLYNDYSTPSHDLFWENEELNTLISKEKMKKIILENNPLMSEARKEAVGWILGVVEFYEFSNVTAVLAVDYFDRFLCGFEFKREKEKPWMLQLVAVACVSIAAKVEETRVPLLLDLQVEDSRYVFEAKTIQKMEILVLSTLEWKMNPVTPISFIDHFARRFGFKNHFCRKFLDRCEFLVVALVSDSRFMRFLPSVLATATMLHIINALNPSSKTEYQNQLLNTLQVNKDQLEDCFKLIRDTKSGVSTFQVNKKRTFRANIPKSPNGVIDICFGSNCSNDSWAFLGPENSPEPLSKKIKLLCNEDGFSL